MFFLLLIYSYYLSGIVVEPFITTAVHPSVTLGLTCSQELVIFSAISNQIPIPNELYDALQEGKDKDTA